MRGAVSRRCVPGRTTGERRAGADCSEAPIELQNRGLRLLNHCGKHFTFHEKVFRFVLPARVPEGIVPPLRVLAPWHQYCTYTTSAVIRVDGKGVSTTGASPALMPPP